MSEVRLNAYKIMWLFVFFDLPTNTKKERHDASVFRKRLLKDGFTMMQYSVYIRHSASRENTETHIQRVKSMLPGKGMVSIITITDKQFGDVKHFWGKKRKKPPPEPKQLEMF